tara:strand:- start:1335 stop:2165 length:831 start_codon:yes stop_codon:yes gene_type:complete
MNQVAKTEDPASILESVMIGGDLSRLSEKERVSYYQTVCDSLSLNPMTKPFDYIKLNGKLQLYAKRDCADQLRAIHGVSIKVLEKEEIEGVYIVSVAAQNKHGRHDEDTGAVTIAGLRGEARANAILKAITKAKRRVTLSICGLGMIDETEASDIPGQQAKYNLDELFGEEIKNGAPDLPQIAVEAPPEPDIPEEIDTPPEPLKLAIDDSHQFYTEYLDELTKIFNDEGIPARQRMTNMKKFMQANKEGLDKIPEAGSKKLEDKRKEYNKLLGPKK